jgi:hypothetical protein
MRAKKEEKSAGNGRSDAAHTRQAAADNQTLEASQLFARQPMHTSSEAQRSNRQAAVQPNVRPRQPSLHQHTNSPLPLQSSA